MSRCQFIRDHRTTWPIALMATILEVSASAYHAWMKRPKSNRQKRHEELAERVQDVFEASHGTYGSRKIAHALKEQEIDICRNTAAKIMREISLKSRVQKRSRFTTTTDSNHDDPVAPNLLDRNFKAAAPNRKWVADITYVETTRGFAYLAAVMDLFSRRIVGWAVSDTLETDLVFDALESAIRKRNPSAGLIHHSDRGCQYASDRYRRLLRESGIACSMSRRGDCYDNASMERFMNSFKNEWSNHEAYGCAEDVRLSAFTYIEIFYNRERLHQALGYVSPAAFEDQHHRSTAA